MERRRKFTAYDFSLGARRSICATVIRFTGEQLKTFDAIPLRVVGMPGVRGQEGVETMPQIELHERLVCTEE